MPDIKIENLCFSYKKRKEVFSVLNNLSIEFESNKIHVILGKSGSGKTTLLQCICGLKNYEEGHIYYDDIVMDSVPVKDRKIGYVSQEFALYPHFSIFKSISYPLAINNTPVDEIRKRVYQISEEFGIRPILSRKPRQISIGQAQRAVLARALIKRPTICLLDEPLSNIDYVNRQELRHFIKETMHKYGCTVIYVTHDLTEATSIADYIYLLDEGQINIKGTPQEIIKSKDPKIKEFFEGLKDETI